MESLPSSPLLDTHLHVSRAKASTATPYEQGLLALGHEVGAMRKPTPQGRAGAAANRHDTRLVSLARDTRQLLIQIDVVAVDSDDLGEAQP